MSLHICDTTFYCFLQAESDHFFRQAVAGAGSRQSEQDRWDLPCLPYARRTVPVCFLPTVSGGVERWGASLPSSDCAALPVQFLWSYPCPPPQRPGPLFFLLPAIHSSCAQEALLRQGMRPVHLRTCGNLGLHLLPLENPVSPA